MQKLHPKRRRPSPKVAIARRKKPSNPSQERRSPCPVACALDIFGDRWTLLVVRDLMLGRSRFKDFAASPESIPTNILSERLARLRRHGVVEQRPVSEGSKRYAYHLTEKGESLREVMRAMKNWGLQWEEGTEAKLEG